MPVVQSSGSATESLTDVSSKDVSETADTIVSNTAKHLELTSYTTDIDNRIRTQTFSRDSQNRVRFIEGQIDTMRDRYPEATFEVNTPEQQFVMPMPTLSLAFEHLLSNAVEHNDKESPLGDVLNHPTSKERYVEDVIADNDPGIPHQEQVFLLEGKEEPLNHGSGLGLWTVNWIINRSGGYISFSENELRGSRLSLGISVVTEELE